MFTEPSVSTEASCLTKALFFANLPAARERAMFTCAGNHCGTIAAAIPTAKINASCKEKFANNAIIINITLRINVPIVSL